MKHNISCIHYCKLDGTCLKIKGNFLGFKYTKSCDWHPLYNFKCREPFERPPLLLQAKENITKIKGEGMEEKKSNKWEFCYTLNKKEHKENPVKIQGRWHEEDWKLLEGFNEDCGENMKLRTAKKEFKPFTLNIEINTIDEVKSLWNIFNLKHTPLLYDVMGKDYYSVELENRIKSSKYKEQLDNVLKDLGEEPDVKP